MRLLRQRPGCLSRQEISGAHESDDRQEDDRAEQPGVAAINRIGRLDVWFPTITACRVDGNGVGAHRYMTSTRGADIIDRIVAIDPARRRLTYQRVKSPFP